MRNFLVLMDANLVSWNYLWFSTFFLIVTISGFIVCVIKNLNLGLKIKLLSVLTGARSSDYLYDMIQRLSIKYFDDFLLNQVTEYYKRNIISPESLREAIENLRNSNLDYAHKSKIEMSLRQALIQKPTDALGEIYASCLINEKCHGKPFVPEIKLIRDIIWDDILYIEARKEIYLSMKKCYMDYIAKTSDENHKKLIGPLVLIIEGQIAEYS